MKFFTFLIAFSLFFDAYSQASNVNLLGRYQYSQELSDVWGYADSSGNEYALVGSFVDFSIVDVTDPANCVIKYYLGGPISTWRDIKVWNKRAYITNENRDGLLIVDMSKLPSQNNLDTTHFYGSQYPFTKAHNVYIDENGFAYIIGANYKNGGAIILDLNQDPDHPVEVGLVDNFYLHDAMVRGDTLWGSAIYDGLQVMMDVSNRTSPVLLGSFDTPGKFAHNCWPSDDGDYVFTTDEINSGKIGAYDVSDFDNPIKVDEFGIQSISTPIPHNTFFKKNFLYTSHYSEGLHIMDVTHPGGMVEVGKFDTSPLYDNKFHGAWGVYPYLPSGNILIADIEEGLFVLYPNVTQASYLHGKVTDTITNNIIAGAGVRIGVQRQFYTQEYGNYNAGHKSAGSYDVKFEKAGYDSKLVKNVSIQTGQITILNVMLTPTFGPIISNKEEDLDENYFLVYPNPVGNELKIETNEKIENLKIYNGKGQIVLEAINATQDVSTLSRGVYLLEVIFDNNKRIKQKLFKR